MRVLQNYNSHDLGVEDQENHHFHSGKVREIENSDPV